VPPLPLSSVPPPPLSSVLVEVVVVVVLDEELVVVLLVVGAAAPPVVVTVVVLPPPQAAIPAPAPTPRAMVAAMAASRFIALLPVAYRAGEPTQAIGANRRPGSSGAGLDPPAA
jgi:hypothetical protein